MEFKPSKSEELISQILIKKNELEKNGKHPRVVLLGVEAFLQLEKEWLEDVKDLPWGDALVYEMGKRASQNHDMFLGDGTILGLWVVKVDTIVGFEIK